jgi:hypothetical protein
MEPARIRRAKARRMGSPIRLGFAVWSLVRRTAGVVTLMDAIDQQAGLKLERRKRPARVLAIDRVEEQPTDN